MKKIQKNAKAVMYRIIPVLSVVCVVLALAVPTRAAETTSELYNVLDYASANDSGSNYFSYYSPETVVYDLPASKFISYVDIVVLSVGVINGIAIDMPSDTDYEPQILEPQEIYHEPDTDYYLYRFCGNIAFARFHAIELIFVGEVELTKEYYAEILQFDIGTIASGYEISTDYFVVEGNTNNHALRDASGDGYLGLSGLCNHNPNHNEPAEITLTSFGVLYDRLDFVLTVIGDGASDFSVVATDWDGRYVSAGSVTCELITALVDSGDASSAYVYLVTANLADLNLSDNGVVEISFLVNPDVASDGAVTWQAQLSDFVGYMYDNTTDSEYPYYHGIVGWLQKIWNSITDGFNRVIEGIEDLTGVDLTGQDSADEFNDKIDSLKPGMDEDIKDLNNVDKPVVSDVKTNPSDLVSQEGTDGAVLILSTLVAYPLANMQLIAVVGVMLVAYVLHGKKG